MTIFPQIFNKVGRFFFVFNVEPSSTLHIETSHSLLTYRKVYAKRMKETKIGQQIQANMRNPLNEIILKITKFKNYNLFVLYNHHNFLSVYYIIYLYYAFSKEKLCIT